MSYPHWIWIVPVAIAALFYLVGPILILNIFKLHSPTRILYFEPDNLNLPQDVARYLLPARKELVALGFEPVSYFCLPDFVANVKSINVLLFNDDTLEGAMINCIYAETPGGGGAPIKTKYVEFNTRFRDGVYVLTNNSPVVGGFRAQPDSHTVQFWNVQDVAELYRLHTEICKRLSTAPHKLRFRDEFDSDVEEYLQTAAVKEPLDYQTECGLMYRVADGYRLTVKGAFELAWKEMWPWKYFRKLSRQREAKRWLKEIEWA